MKDVLKRTGLALLSTLGILILFGLLLGFLEARVTARLCGRLGWWAVLATAVIGTPVHEACHWLMCRIFGLNVTEVALFRPVAARRDGVLGYVSYTLDRSSLLQRLGSFFSGVAPLLLGVFFIFLVVRLLTPEAWRSAEDRIGCLPEEKKDGAFQVFGASFLGFWRGIFHLEGWGILRGILCVYLVISISMHMSLSFADLQCAAVGFPVLLLAYLIFGIVTAIAGTDCRRTAARSASFLISFLSIGVVFDLILLLLTALI